MANEIKLKRYEATIVETINRTIVFEVKNKIAKNGRVTYAQLTNDLSLCKAYIECLDRTTVQVVADNLNEISGLFRSKVAEALNIYKTPKILFLPDKSIDYADNIDKIISKLHEKD